MRRTVLVFLVVLVVTFISPFSSLPNPLGIAYLIFGGYSYDARLPFQNRFAITLKGNAEEALRPKLEALLGATGLDPLDPTHALRAYQIETITYRAGDWAHANVQMIYADGSSRRYSIPVVQSEQSWGRPGGWAYTGLDRYFAPHLEVPNLTFAGPDAPVRLGEPQRLALPAHAQQLGTGSLSGWYTSAPRQGEELAWAPDGKAFLLYTASSDSMASSKLWLVRLDGEDAVPIAENVQHYAWSSAGQWIVFLRAPGNATQTNRLNWDVVAVDRARQRELTLGRTAVLAPPVVVGDTVWFLDEGSVWRASLSESSASPAPSQRATLPDIASERPFDIKFAVSAEQRLAYRCGDALCLIDVGGGGFVRVDLGALPRAPTPTPRPPSLLPAPPPSAPTLPPARRPSGPEPQRPAFAQLALAWNPAGDRLAAVASDYSQGAMPTLWIVDRLGNVLRRVLVGPNGFTRAPQWTPDGRWIFLNTFPEAGRRIVAVESTSAQPYDLSHPRWDTFFSLAPDGQRLLLWNGRGGFWTVPLQQNTEPRESRL